MKKIYYLLIAFILVGVLVGCSNSETKKDNSNDNSAASINEKGFPIVDEDITIEMVGQKNPIQAEWKDIDRKSTRLNSSHVASSYAVFCLKRKMNTRIMC